jgi:hypothetical protein
MGERGGAGGGGRVQVVSWCGRSGRKVGHGRGRAMRGWGARPRGAGRLGRAGGARPWAQSHRRRSPHLPSLQRAVAPHEPALGCPGVLLRPTDQLGAGPRAAGGDVKGAADSFVLLKRSGQRAAARLDPPLQLDGVKGRGGGHGRTRGRRASTACPAEAPTSQPVKPAGVGQRARSPSPQDARTVLAPPRMSLQAD